MREKAAKPAFRATWTQDFRDRFPITFGDGSLARSGLLLEIRARRGGRARMLYIVQLRSAEPGDESALATVHLRSWQVAYRGLLPDDFLDQLAPPDCAARYTFAGATSGRPHTILAVNDEEICGFATTGPCRDPDKPDAGELYAVYVHPDWWNRGVGRALIEAARSRLAEQRFSQAVLWAMVGNERAERFYRVDGWKPDGECRLEEVHGITVNEIRYTRSLP